MALCGCNHRFVTCSVQQKIVMATSNTANEKALLAIAYHNVFDQGVVHNVLIYVKYTPERTIQQKV